MISIRFSRRYLGFLLFAICFFVRQASAEIRYSVSAQPEQHSFRVEMVVWANSPNDTDIVVALPAWNALYQIRDFSSRLSDLRALTLDVKRQQLAVTPIDKQTWRIALPAYDPSSPNRGADITYSIVWDDPGPFGTQLNSHHAFINFAEILLYVPSRREEESTVVFHGFPWKVIAELPEAPVDESRFAFTAPSYDKLVDAPVEAGTI